MYRNISIKKELADIIEQFIESNPDFGFRSIAQFLEDAARERLEQIGAIGKVVMLEHDNLDEEGVRILDNSLGFRVHVIFRPEGIWCEYDKTDNCKHIQFALRQEDVKKIIRKKQKDGWNLPDV